MIFINKNIKLIEFFNDRKSKSKSFIFKRKKLTEFSVIKMFNNRRYYI